MKQLFGNLVVNFIAGLWLSLKVAQCQDNPRSNVPYCFDTSSRKTCFTTFFDSSGSLDRVPFEEASKWCKDFVPGSSLIVIDSLESKTTVEIFIGRQSLQNVTIITDGRMLSKSESLSWSWVNGHPYSPDVGPLKDIMDTAEQFHDAACVDTGTGRGQSLAYCFDNASTEMSFICEGFSQHDNRRYKLTAYEGNATWHNARKNCLKSGGDLATLTDLQTMKNFTRLRENQKYWIGLHRNNWIWNSTGAALTYTNWENGFPDESPDKQCMCFIPKCRNEGGRSRKCESGNNRKWRTCNCNNSYAIVCQKVDFLLPEEKPSNPRYTTRVKTSTDTTPIGTATSTRQIDSFDTTWIVLIVLFVTVVIIIVAVILIIRKRKHDKRLDGSPMENVNQGETAANVSLYATVVPGNGLSEVNTLAGNIIYAEVDKPMSQGPTPSNTIYASVQPTTETIDMGKNVVYADLDLLENINKSQ